MAIAKLTWNGQAMERDGEGHLVWVDTPNPVGGDVVSMGTLGMMAWREGDTFTHYEVPVTLWGDYCGDSVSRSNYRSLLEDYPETFIEVKGHYFSQCLAIPRGQVTEELRDIFHALSEKYPLYDDEDHSNLEMEEATSQYDEYLRADILCDLERKHDVDTDTIDTDKLDALFWQWQSNASEHPYLETATTVYFPGVDKFVAMVATERLSDVVRGVEG